MEIRAHPAARGWQWLVSGAALFRRHAGLWLVILGASFLALKILLLIPFIGPLFLVAMPVVLAGMMELCRAIEFGKPRLLVTCSRDSPVTPVRCCCSAPFRSPAICWCWQR